jgi:very-short-patch-repair endonuclease
MRINNLLKWKAILSPEAYEQAVQKYRNTIRTEMPIDTVKPQLKTTEIPDYFWAANNLPTPHREYRFHPTRKWRIDFAFPETKIAIEIEGGVYQRGRHNRPIGYIKDLEKYNALQIDGWKLLRYLPHKINFEEICFVYKERIKLMSCHLPEEMSLLKKQLGEPHEQTA